MKLNIYGNQPIITPRDPVLPMEAANKNYVDTGLSLHAGNLDLHLSTAQNIFLDGVTITSTEVNRLAGITDNVQGLIDTKLNLTGGTLAGTLTLAGDPTGNLQASTKQYSDAQDALKVSKTGDIMSGFLTLSANPELNLHAATKQYVDTGISTHASNEAIHITAGQNELLDGLVVTSTEINYLEGTTAKIQTQLDSKLNLSGGTLTGALTLASDPSTGLQPATKQYSDAQDALKVAKAGDTLTGPLILSADPTLALEATTKQYSDSTLAAHATNEALHVTADQNTFLDGITVTSAEVNSLAGVTSDVQAQINTKFDKAGGVISGDITLDAGKTIFVSKAPITATELVNKAYVDARLNGNKWEDPVSDVNLVGDALATPPAVPVTGDVYIVGAVATGAWAGKEGYAAYHNGTTWVFLQDRAVAVGDRFGVKLTTGTATTGGLVGKEGKLVTISSAIPGSIQYTDDTLGAASTTLVFDPSSSKFGITYTLTDESNWVPTNTSVNLSAGDGLSLVGNMLNFNYGSGLQLVDDVISVNLDTASGIGFDANKVVRVNLDGVTLTASATGVKVSDAVIATLNDKLSRTETSTVTGKVTFGVGSSLNTDFAATDFTHVVNKGYVDAADTKLTTDLGTVSTRVSTLELDPTTKTYVDAQDSLKVAKTGDTLTGPLFLAADPTSNLQATTKQYSDSTLAAHATNEALHLTVGQNTFLDGVTVTAIEVNRLAGVTSDVQTQLDSKLNLAGGTLTGPLVLDADPADLLEAATKQYTDTKDLLKVNKAGDTLTGSLILAGDPTVALEAVTKQYADVNLSSHATDATLHLTGGQNTFLDGITVTSTEVNQLTGVTGQIQTQLDGKLNLTGGTLTGALTLVGDPTGNLQPSTKAYSDAQDALKVTKAGDTLTGPLILAADPVANLEAATKQYIDAGLSNIKTYADTQDNTKVNKSGDILTGPLVLAGNPSADLQAAPKQYVDSSITTLRSYVDTQDTALDSKIGALQTTVTSLNTDPVTKNYVDTQDSTKLPLAGGSMAGYITLHADPQQSMHPATKQYVDAIAQGLSIKTSVRVATTAPLTAVYNNGTFGVNSTLTGSVNGALVIDGVAPAVNDRILVKEQTVKAENGDYTVQQVGDAGTPYILKRIPTIDESSEVPGSYFYVYDGLTLKATGWVLTVSNPVTFSIGTDDINVNQFFGQGNLIAGNGATITGNTIDINTANPARIVVNADNIDLATTGVTPGSYTKVVVDGYGRATSGSNPNTLAGYGITDGQPLNANLTSLSGVTTVGVVVRDSTNTVVTKGLEVTGTGLGISNSDASNTGNIVISSNATSDATAGTVVSRDSSGNFKAGVITADLSGNATTSTTLATPRDIVVTGDITTPVVSFNGGANVTLTATLADSGVAAGQYTKLTVNGKGLVTAGETPTTAAGLGLGDVYTKAEVDALVTDLRKQLSELHLYILSRI